MLTRDGNSLAIIGAGRVGRALGRQLRELGWKIGAVITRSEASARRAVRFMGGGKAYARMTRQVLAFPVILIVTPDDEIAVVAQELARIGAEELRGKVVLHTSGALDSRAGFGESLRRFGRIDAPVAILQQRRSTIAGRKIICGGGRPEGGEGGATKSLVRSADCP